MHRYRTHNCGALRAEQIGSTVRLSGWCHRIRDHGGLLFIDLRDHYGLTQVVADPISRLQDCREAALGMGRQGRRPGAAAPGRTENSGPAPTGAVEVFATDIEVLGPAGELPMPVFGDQKSRGHPPQIPLPRPAARPAARQHHEARQDHRSAAAADEGAGLLRVPDPDPDGVEPGRSTGFLVPSRLHPGKFYALPQAPQQFKQLIMVSGFDRYFQIAPCFRDEDARADRSPGEFYQLDIEMSFVTQEDVFAAVEPVLRGVFEEFADGKPVTPKFPLIPYADALKHYGTDKPDLRNPIKMADVTAHFRDPGFKVFAGMIAADPAVEVWAIPAPKGGNQHSAIEWTAGQRRRLARAGYIFWRGSEGTRFGTGRRKKGCPEGY
jgi:aspartyl-tRNA synthetase